MPATSPKRAKKPASKKRVKAASRSAGATLPKRKKKPSPGIADARVLGATGHSTDHWFKILDARTKASATPDHKDLASHLHRDHQCPMWWSQMVTVLYERARGHRVVGQRPDGFSVNGSRTIKVPMTRMYRAWSGRQLAHWYQGEPWTVSKATANRSIRMKQSDGTNVEVMFYDQTTKAGVVKSQVTIQHNRLKGQAAAARMKKQWAAQLDRLREYLER